MTEDDADRACLDLLVRNVPVYEMGAGGTQRSTVGVGQIELKRGF